MNNSNRSPSIMSVLLTVVLGVTAIALIVALSKGSGEYYLKPAAGPVDPCVQELANSIPRKYEYNRPSPMKLKVQPISDPAVRQQARELAKAWIHVFYTRMNNYTHEFCFLLVDKERYSIDAVTLAAKAFQARDYKVRISDSGFYYIVEIAE